ncbi:Kelch repeat-containing protein [Rugosimonospora acidiphila]
MKLSALITVSLLAMPSVVLASSQVVAAQPSPQQRDVLSAATGPAPRAAAQDSSTVPWQTLAQPAPFHPDTALLLTDGTVMAQDYATANWWKLTPDASGEYGTGTWTQLPPMPNGYAPYDYCSAVLADGRVIVEGGEYTYVNGVASTSETNQGAIYDPVANTWQVLDPPPGWTRIGDASCLVLPDGKFLLARNFNSTPAGQVAMLDPATLAWTVMSPPGKADGNSEENWTLLPDGTVLAVDVHAAPGAERFIPPWLDGSSDGEWISAGQVPSVLAGHGDPGPQVLRPDGTVFAVGDNGFNAVYTPPSTLFATGSWSSAPSFPTVAGEGQLGTCDGPAMLLPNGNVLVGASPGCYNLDDHFFEFDGTDLTEVEQPAFASRISSFWARLLMLPTGEVLVTYDNRSAYVYRPTGGPDPSWAPHITACPGPIVTAGKTYVVAGRQLNGLSQAESYGDDEAAASNYPLVRITNHATGHVIYARTHDHSSMGVATGDEIVSTNVDIPALERGADDLQVVTNGIASNRCVVNQPRADAP